jgi:chorismate dehydratase
MEYKKNVPAKINSAFLRRNVDAAFISSIKAKGQRSLQLGIIAKKKVRSVIVLPAKANKKDVESASSNILASVLGLDGEVLIGDKALRYVLEHEDYIDLAEKWHDIYQLPFVFALLCYHKDANRYKKIQNEFLKRSVKIPQYLLEKASKKTAVKKQDILDYLTFISYELDYKAEKGLHRFYKEAKKI